MTNFFSACLSIRWSHCVVSNTTVLETCPGEADYNPQAPIILSANLRFQNNSSSPLKKMQNDTDIQDYWIKDYGGNLSKVAFVGLTVSRNVSNGVYQ